MVQYNMKEVFILTLLCTSLFADGRFLKYNGYVKDLKSSLFWQDQSPNEQANVNFKDAQEYCSKLTLGSLTWRLPTQEELLSIVDFKAFDPAAYDSFKHVASEEYWSSESEGNKKAKSVYFGSGCTSSYKKTEKLLARCVASK